MNLMNNGTKYFDKRIPEEDSPIEVNDEDQECYRKLEEIYESFFEENFLSVAKVVLT
jgi:hypothetical protein